MSSANKMRDRLASMTRDRESFERKKKELEADMTQSRGNLEKIKKGLKNNTIGDINVEVTLSAVSSPSLPQRKESFISPGIRPSTSQKLKSLILSSPNGKSTTNLLSPPNGSPSAGNIKDSFFVIPSGQRVSDWCFTGSLDSTPPIVKNYDLYETVRLLGRGAFGDVNLVKNKDDNKL